jgi:hypothetical protein
LIAQQPNLWFDAVEATSIMDLKEIVSANIRRLRLKRGLSQSDHATEGIIQAIAPAKSRPSFVGFD